MAVILEQDEIVFVHDPANYSRQFFDTLRNCLQNDNQTDQVKKLGDCLLQYPLSQSLTDTLYPSITLSAWVL